MKRKVSLNFTFLVLLLIILSCKKKDEPQNDSPVHILLPDSASKNPAIEVGLKLYDDVISPIVPADFLGFSFEKLALTDITYFNISNTSFINLYKNLGGGVIRIGGNTVEKIFWSQNKRNSSRQDSVYTDDVDRFKEFSKAVGWNTIWGLNLGMAQPTNDALEAKYIKAKLGEQLNSFAIGNEPDYYGLNALRPKTYDYNAYKSEFNIFSNVLKDKVPGAIFSGPDTNTPEWGSSFLKDNGGKINQFSLHYYRMGPAGSPVVTMDRLMKFDIWLAYLIKNLKPGADAHHIPFRFSECNSVYRGGQPGISNSFGSSLWGSEFLFYLAQQGVAGANFHSGSESSYVYSPINTINGKSVARPLYYAMLLFHQAAVKQFLNAELQNNGVNADVYSFIRKDGKRGIVVINKEDKNDVSLTINNGHDINSTEIYQLKGPSLSSTTGTNINGITVDSNGMFKSDGYMTNLDTPNKSIQVKITAASALLIILN